ncbi:PREDICTED: protein PHLOEM PROTEIN 2-LIKE A9 isoform X1 [Camelina sativa]|uniref:Protein PHLOEM PROTEIN 2-LIKE A9 isoform X1 n=1 Tax=Camelina sativa TaxID=90675 RepID=A0ABM0XTA7_CAMSA|nr:PREDICTED: protein PHLOEM PROTEIN 2-LIKE A9 isoform X1 [Camelina sativa]
MSVQKAVKSSHYQAESNMEHDIVRKAWVFKPSGLNFIWGGDSQYWVIPKEDRTPAELKMVSWLEVTGSYDKIEPGKTYRIGFKISLTADATGWDQAPVFMSAKIGKKGKTIWKRIKSLNNNIEKLKRRTGPVNIPDDTDGRFEVFVSPNITINQDTKLQFGLYEVWTGKWKTGLLIYEAFVEEV